MIQAKEGDTVRVHYTGKLSDGTIFDSSVDREPFQFELGSGQVIRGFDEALLGMSPGETKSTSIPADEAYGPYRDDMVMVIKREQLPEHIEPEVGLQLESVQPNGQSVVLTVTEVTDSSVTLDANHPLAGQDLTFEIELIEIL
ncbi:MAG: peptidylprolyl isomerase [Calditrichaeota bacterium]|nr:MAG: peptidylprolyl isomerase [Calditrichota bacterium]